jgi:hypothetical protein
MQKKKQITTTTPLANKALFAHSGTWLTVRYVRKHDAPIIAMLNVIGKGRNLIIASTSCVLVDIFIAPDFSDNLVAIIGLARNRKPMAI